MEQQEIELIDYLNVIWKRKGLIMGGTLVAAAAALVVSLSMPKTYEVSRTLKIGKLQARVGEKGKLIENREAVIGRLKDHRVLTMVMEKIHLGLTSREMEALVLIDTKTNPDVRYIVQIDDPQGATRIADLLAGYIIKVHKPIYERGLQIAKEYEAELAANIRSLETENRNLRRILEKMAVQPNFDPIAVVILQTNIGEQERNLITIRRELNLVRLSQVGSENTSVIAADAPPKHAVKPRIKLNVVLAGTLGLMMFTFVAFFMEYIEKAKGRGK